MYLPELLMRFTFLETGFGTVMLACVKIGGIIILVFKINDSAEIL